MTAPWPLHLGVALYGVNVAVGVAAQFGGLRLGVLHHWLYGFVFASSLAAALASRHPALFLTLTALLLLPFTRGGTVRHPAVALIGALGYLGAYCG